MNLFSRTRTADTAHLVEAVNFAVDIGQHVSKVTGLDIIPWTTMYGAPLGTLAWSTRVDSVSAMGAAQEKLLADAGYLERINKNAHLFIGSAEDLISEFVAVAGTSQTVGKYATIVAAQCASGRISDAMAWSVDIMNHVAAVTDSTVSLVRGLYGPFATLAWVSSVDSLEQVDAANAALGVDASYLGRLDKGGPLFTPGTVESRLLRRLG